MIKEANGEYIRLVDKGNAQHKKESAIAAVQDPVVPYSYLFNQQNYKNIPQSLIVYWVSPAGIRSFQKEMY